MFLSKPITHPNSSQSEVHRITSLNLFAGDPSAPSLIDTVIISLASHANAESPQPVFQQSIRISLDDFMADTYPENVIAALTKPGQVLEGAQVIEELDPVLTRAQKEALARVDVLRENNIAAGFVIEGVGPFDSDPTSVRNITGKAQRAAVALARNEEDWVTPWKLADDSMVVFDANGMIAVGEALDAHITNSYARSWELKALIAEAETAEEVLAIDLNTDWP